MQPWERRLKDLAQILANCEATYFDPETFRINTNQFLQTSRTVTFIVQKNKNLIPGFDAWYTAYVLEPWSKDKIMIWARDSRNKIEKEGDLEFYSSVGVTLVFSYFEEEDIILPCGRGELVSNIKRLLRFARRQLPTGVSDGSVVKIDRQWIANTLRDWELLHALTYIYARVRDACASLAKHLNAKLDEGIPDSAMFDPLSSDARKTRYLRLNTDHLSGYVARRVKRDPDFVPHPRLASFISENSGKKPRTLTEIVDWYSAMAKITFEHCGNHVPMLFLFDQDGTTIDYISTAFEDQSSKYLFWRSMADRVLYLKPSVLIWICESWLRDSKGYPYGIVRNMPIIGEKLSVVGLDCFGSYLNHTFSIYRDETAGIPHLEAPEVEGGSAAGKENYLVPVVKAFQKLRMDASK